MHMISSAIWESTQRCNLSCLHCLNSKDKYGKELSTNESKKMIKELAEYGVKELVITGGEPTLRKDLKELTEYSYELVSRRLSKVG